MSSSVRNQEVGDDESSARYSTKEAGTEAKERATRRSTLPKVQLGSGRLEALVAEKWAQGLAWWLKPSLGGSERCSVAAVDHTGVYPPIWGVANRHGRLLVPLPCEQISTSFATSLRQLPLE
jgi:hypothetical protein